MITEQDIQALKQQVYQEPVIYEWEFIGAGGKHAPLTRWVLSILAGFTLPIFLFCVEDVGYGGTFTLLSVGVIGMLMSRYLFIPDNHYQYKLTKLGIHYTQEQVIPEVAYTVIRGIAWVGILVCLLALMVIGPLAFVGAGAFGLMAFGMTNFTSKVDKFSILFYEANVLFNTKNDLMLDIRPQKKSGLAFVGKLLSSSLEQKQILIEQLVPLLSALGELEVIEIKRHNDIYKHPMYDEKPAQ
ncbi:hypothetical protein HQQ94_07140 [Shewanella sp. VB17]|uniref:hypothetical protein n=1 Tax=Shewanella sp. VB17 TaxID=2739432 RepID=UPI00156418B2|nr:hypothetical protein [Shewanella sp. VB17]NRD73017.1 hypothetical protein [Shewanella sp. VB17]